MDKRTAKKKEGLPKGHEHQWQVSSQGCTCSLCGEFVPGARKVHPGVKDSNDDYCDEYRDVREGAPIKAHASPEGWHEASSRSPNSLEDLLREQREENARLREMLIQTRHQLNYAELIHRYGHEDPLPPALVDAYDYLNPKWIPGGYTIIPASDGWFAGEPVGRTDYDPDGIFGPAE